MTNPRRLIAQPHGEIRKVFDDIFMVRGRFRMTAGPPIAFSRNMVIIRHNTSLTLVNSMQLSEAELARLAELGKVDNVIRLAGFHGADDRFYKERFAATIHAVAGQVYARGFAQTVAEKEQYFSADVEIDETSQLPVPGAKLVTISSARPPEGLLLLEREGGILIAGDALQNWATTDRYFNLFGKLMMRAMGFIKPYAIGPGWLKTAKPDPRDVRNIRDLPFEHVLPAHGDSVIGAARAHWRKAFDALPER